MKPPFVEITYKGKPEKAAVLLPGSKSIANRALIINALAGKPATLVNVPDADDSKILAEALKSCENLVDTGHAGTAFRFLTALFAVTGREVLLTGSSRMKQRPVGILVDALCRLGAKIDYAGKHGYPPLYIRKGNMEGGTIAVDAGVSSQFVSALMMIAPVLKGGLTIQLTGRPVSKSYILMTAKVMRGFGVEVDVNNEWIRIPQGNYRCDRYVVEADWSGAAFWYAWVHLRGSRELLLSGLNLSSVQGDVRLAGIYGQLGITSAQEDEGVRIAKEATGFDFKDPIDFSNNPDIVPTFLVNMALAGKPVELTGIGHLRIKESDRVAVLCKELQRFGAEVTQSENRIVLSKGISGLTTTPVFDTYDDHRMAMAFALFVLHAGKIAVRHPEVVTKSYPGFWEQLQRVLKR